MMNSPYVKYGSDYIASQAGYHSRIKLYRHSAYEHVRPPEAGHRRALLRARRAPRQARPPPPPPPQEVFADLGIELTRSRRARHHRRPGRRAGRCLPAPPSRRPPARPAPARPAPARPAPARPRLPTASPTRSRTTSAARASRCPACPRRSPCSGGFGLRLAIASSSPIRLIDAVCTRLNLDIDVRCSALDEPHGKPPPMSTSPPRAASPQPGPLPGRRRLPGRGAGRESSGHDLRRRPRSAADRRSALPPRRPGPALPHRADRAAVPLRLTT